MRRDPGVDWLFIGGLAAGILSFGLITLAILTIS